MPKMFSAGSIAVMGRVRDAFDPSDLCNPGKALPDPTALRGGSRDVPPARDRDGRARGAAVMVAHGAGAASLHRAGRRGPRAGRRRRRRGRRRGPGPGGLAGGRGRGRVGALRRDGARTRGRRARRRHEDRLGFAAGALRRRAVDRPDRGHRRPRAGGPRLRRPGGDDARSACRRPSPPHPGFRQRLMLDPPQGARATIGGVVATAASGPLRTRFGTPRDLVIGASFVLSDGTVGRSGGKVVKNVAGFDVAKLLVGSLGTLAVDHRGGLPPPSAAGGIAHRRPRIAVGDRALRLRRAGRPAPGDTERGRPALAAGRRRWCASTAPSRAPRCRPSGSRSEIGGRILAERRASTLTAAVAGVAVGAARAWSAQSRCCPRDVRRVSVINVCYMRRRGAASAARHRGGALRARGAGDGARRRCATAAATW